MKLIAIETATGKRFPVSSIYYTSDGKVLAILVYDGKSDSDIRLLQPEQATVHISTDMQDKHGREILVGDSLRNNAESVSCPVYYTGTGFLVPMGSMDFLLTPELAATMEVVS